MNIQDLILKPIKIHDNVNASQKDCELHLNWNWITKIPEHMLTQEIVDVYTSQGRCWTMRYIPRKFRTENVIFKYMKYHLNIEQSPIETWIDMLPYYIKRHDWKLIWIPDELITQEILNQAIDNDPEHWRPDSIPDNILTQEHVDLYMKFDDWEPTYIPDKF